MCVCECLNGTCIVHGMKCDAPLTSWIQNQNEIEIEIGFGFRLSLAHSLFSVLCIRSTPFNIGVECARVIRTSVSHCFFQPLHFAGRTSLIIVHIRAAQCAIHSPGPISICDTFLFLKVIWIHGPYFDFTFNSIYTITIYIS